MSSKFLFSGHLNLLLTRSPYSLCYRLIHKNETNRFDRSKNRKVSGSKFSGMLEDNADQNSMIPDSSTRDSSIKDSSNRESSFEVRPHSYRRAPFSQHVKKLELKTLYQVFLRTIPKDVLRSNFIRSTSIF